MINVVRTKPAQRFGNRRVTQVFILLCLALLSAAAAAADSPMIRTDQGHLRPPPGPGSGAALSPGPGERPRWALPPEVVINKPKDSWRKAGKFDKKLTDACSAGEFREYTPMRFRAQFQDDVLGVAFGHGLNLYDPKRQADRKQIYFFRFGESSGCLVLSTPNKDPQITGAARP